MKKAIITLMLLTFIMNVYCQIDPIDSLIHAKLVEKKIPGLQIAIVKNGEIIKSGSFGIANMEDDIKVDSNTTFAINSITKAFTGVAVMQLVEEGKISLNNPISHYLDSIPPNWRTITVNQLLTHTSGLPDMMDYNAKIVATWEEVQQLPMVFEANEDFRYNQTNYVLIGRIIHKVSGLSFEKFIQKRQLEPSNATRTIEAGFGHYQSVIPHSARGYTYFVNGSLTHAYESFPPEFRTAAGMSSTANDLANWAIALQNGKLLKEPKSLSNLWEPAILNNGKTKGFSPLINGYAIGTPVIVKPNQTIIASIGGGRSAIFIYPEKEITIVILTNLQGAFPERFMDEIITLIE